MSETTNNNLTPLEQRALLAQLLQDKARSQATFAPLSHGQSALWFLHQLDPTSPAYNVMCAAFVRPEADQQALSRAFQKLLERHSVLRTTYGAQEGKPVQFVHPRLKSDLQVVDASSWTWPQLEAELHRQADVPFDLEHGPVVRLHLYQRSQEQGVLLIMAHHIAMDFWSIDLVCEELEQLYQADTAGTSLQLPRLATQYVDFVDWQQRLLSSEAGEQMYEYWRDHLQGDLPVLDLPTDRPRPALQSFNGRSHRFRWPDELSRQVLALAKQQGTTLYATLLAVFQVLLHRQTAQQDILVASFTAGRSQAELEPIVGYFLNPIVLRGRPSPGMRFSEFLTQVRETALDGVTHQDYPFSLLVERFQPARDPSRSPIFQVAFGLDRPRRVVTDGPRDAASNGSAGPATDLGLEPFLVGQQGAPLDLMLTMLTMAESMSGALQYNSDLFDETTIVRLVEQYQQLMTSVVSDPDQRIEELCLLSDEQQHTLLHDWNDTRRTYPRESCVHKLFEQQAQQTPAAVAVSQGERQLTYQQLNQQANQLAHYLQSIGAGPGQLVGICMERSPQMLLGLLGILKAGAAYVPLAPDTPPERLAFMLQEGQAQIVVTQSDVLEHLPKWQGKLVCLDRDWSRISQQNTQPPPATASAEDLAYVIFTSGSTGKPKGVQIEHRSVVNFLHSMQRTPGISADDTLLAVTTLTFDISVLELFLPLTVGAQVVMVGREVAADGQQLAETLIRSEATIMQATPATWRLLVEAGWEGSQQLKILCGGEALPRDLADQLLPRCDSLWNMYGPTETTIWSAVDHVSDEVGPVSIGRPIDNTQIYILDARMQAVPVGVTGDLYIGGDGLARGYLDRPELNAERFVSDPFSSAPHARLYKTGDLARYRADGRIEFLGREDFQVKVRGFRIELGEIETHLNQHPAVCESVVVARQVSDKLDDKQLVAYLVPHDEQVPNVSELRDFLKQQLPLYMIPAVFTTLDTLPLNPAGKVDRQALPTPDDSRPRLRHEFVAPRNEIEELVADIWASILNLDQVGVHDDFFELGGASIQSLEIAQRLTAAGYQASPVMIFQYPTIGDLASAISVPQAAVESVDAGATTVEVPAPVVSERQSPETPRSIPTTQPQPTTSVPTARRNTVIESLGVYLPEKELTTSDILKGCKKQMWFPLEKMTGIKSRRVAAEDEFAFELAREAIDECLANSKYDVPDIDLLINCSISRFDSEDSLSAEPSTSMKLRQHYGFENAIAFDVTNACAGMFTSILIADAYINSGHARRALIVSGEYVTDVIRTAQLEISGFLDSRLACLTVGDAGAALILEAADNQKTGFHELEMYTISKYCRMCIGTLTDQPHRGSIMYVPDPMKHTAISVEHAVMHAQHMFEKSPWKPEDVDVLVMHQTSDRSLRDGIRAINKAFKKKICNWDNTINNVKYRGNTASTAQFVAVWDNLFDDRIQTGDNVIFGVTGSGQTIGTGIYTFDDLPDRLRQIRKTGKRPAKFDRQHEQPLVPPALPRVQMRSVATLPLDQQFEHDTPKMTAVAIESCLGNSSYDRSDIELFLFAGLTRTGFISEPAVATLIAGEVKMNEIIASASDKKTLAFDVFNSSLSFLYACELSTRLIQAGTFKTAMVASSEVNMVAPYDRVDPMKLHETASAVILDISSDGSQGFGEFVFRYFPEYADSRITRGVFRDNLPDYHFHCDPQLVDQYLECVPVAVNELLQKEGLEISQIKAVLPSQFSPHFNQGLSDVLGVDRKQVVDVLIDGKDLFTNSIPYSLEQARRTGKVARGDVALIVNVAAGIQVGCATYRF